MGCVSSRKDINDVHPNMFQVMNVDELGQLVSAGQLELTEGELVLHQRGKAATRWPLRCLRKYGFDAEIFSFECGRRCPTGPGIYAFRCRRAEQLFNQLQQHIQLRNLNEEAEFPVPQASNGPPVALRPAQPERPHARFSRPASVTSNGPLSPQALASPPPLDASSEDNNNKRLSLQQPQHSYLNTAAEDAATAHQPYMNVQPATSPTLACAPDAYPQALDQDAGVNGGGPCHLYMNVTPSEAQMQRLGSLSDQEAAPDVEESMHCYANLDPGELEQLRSGLPAKGEGQAPATPPATPAVNYIVLDLDQAKVEAPAGAAAPDSPRKLAAEGYATIDFNKTVALSHSVNPCLELDNEGSRKTRHNSTIANPMARQSNSISD